MATKGTTKKASSQASLVSKRFRSAKAASFSVRFKRSSPNWKLNLENNLVEEGLTRSEARDLVRLAAS